MQSVAVQVTGRGVGRGEQAHALGKQCLEQIAEDHRIADVQHEEFIQAQHARLFGNAFGDLGQRVCGPRQGAQLGMDALHEAMKVDTALGINRQPVEKQIHQEGLAATDTAPQVQTAHRLGSRAEDALPD